jgi:hypothetical protein
MLQRGDVSFGEIEHMHIVPHGCPIFRGILEDHLS